jgi:hypothetical protein
MTRNAAGGRRTAAWAALAAGLCALAAGITTLTGPGVVPDAGAVPASAVEPRAVASAVEPSPAAGAVRSRPTAPASAAPTGVTVAALHVTAPVDPVGVSADSALLVPDDPAHLGWWIGSALPGSPRGTVLIAGHVDTAADGPGALFRLEKLPMGALIGVRAGDRVLTYRAVARRSYGKRRLPPDLFDPGSAPRLVLITCGGDFRHGSYTDNVVLYAVPTT